MILIIQGCRYSVAELIDVRPRGDPGSTAAGGRGWTVQGER